MRRAAALRRAGSLVLVLGLTSSVIGTAVSAQALAARAPSVVVPVTPGTIGATASAMTQAWEEPGFGVERAPGDPARAALRGLEVTVSQTADVAHQGVRVSWSGGRPTSPGRFATDFVQIMQCWGDAETGPAPDQCQWGAPSSSIAAMLGDRVGTRALRANEDPAQDYGDDVRLPPPLTNPNLKAYAVPLRTVDGTRVFDVSEYFTPASTNEITAARTGADGTGDAVLEVQTALEAPHLGCGVPTRDGAGNRCWLVVVPRSGVTPAGEDAESVTSGSVSGSPLTASVWDDRLVFPLDMLPIGSQCAIGAAERRLVGNELFSHAMTSWQSALCRTGTTYGYSQVGDAEARQQLRSESPSAPSFAVLNRPVLDAPGADASADPAQPGEASDAGDAPRWSKDTVLYAPVTRSALVVAFQIDRQPAAGADQSRAGTPLDSLTLNARLVAKLLTQSYRADVPGGGGKAIAGNPQSVTNDPELVELNPELASFVRTAAPEGLMVALGSSDANAAVWAWLRSDPYAAAFLAGEPDEHGMVVNPAYADLGLATDPTTDSFPKTDLSTYRQSDLVPEPGYGTLDLRPYTTDMSDAAARVQRASSGAKIVWDIEKVPAGFTSSGGQLPGQRFALAITDLTSAERFGLRTARLVNAAGQPVAANVASIGKAVDAMTVEAAGGVEGVVATDPSRRTLGAYPLTLVSSAAVAVCRADDTARVQYAQLLEHAAGAGQVVGQAKGLLPAGYAPLSDAERARTNALAATLRDTGSVASRCRADEPPATPDPEPAPTEKPSEPTGPTPPPVTAPTPVPPAPEPVPEPEPTTPPTAADPDTGAPVQVTAAADVGAARLGLVGSLGVGAASALAGPLLVRRAGRLDALDGELS